MISSPRTRRLAWVNLPVVTLIALLQRTPVLRVFAPAGDYAITSSVGQVLRAAVTVATLGAMHSRAGATTFNGPSGDFILSGATSWQGDPIAVNGTVGVQMAFGFSYTGTPSSPARFAVSGSLPPGLAFIPVPQGGVVQSGSPVVAGTPTQAGTFIFTVQGFNPEGLTNGIQVPFRIVIAAAGGGGGSGPSITTQPSNQSASPGGSVNLSVVASGATGVQWQRNGAAIGGATSSSFTVSNLQPETTGLYAAIATSGGSSVTSLPAIVGLSTSGKLVGPGTEFPDIFHAGTGFTYDQILLEGAAASVKPDDGQILRISYIDINDDIVQVEMSGSGTLSLVLAGVSGPAAPTKYNQATTYMKGHVGIVVTGASVNTHLSVFSVGRANAVNQALFNDSITYDGLADIAFIAISSVDGQFGGLRAANTNIFESQGHTGVYAPNVAFTGPVFVGDITATGTATPVLIIGSGSDIRVTGGDLSQPNGRAVQVKGMSQLRFANGSTSHGGLIPAKQNQGVLEQDGTNVSSIAVFSP